MAASSLALVDDRLAFLVSKLPAEEILKIALHGLRTSAATRTFATERHAETYPLPQWCVSNVLLSADLLPKIFSSLSLRDGGRASGACQTWNNTWKAVRQSRALKHEKMVGPALPWVEAESEPLELHDPRSLMALPNRDVVIGTSSGLLHCTPDFKVKRKITHHGNLEIGHVDGMQCDADTVLVVANYHIMSFKLSDLSPRRRCEVGDYYVSPTISADDVFACTRGNQITVLDKASLEERARVGEGMLGGVVAMAVLGERLYVSDNGNYPHARVHIFSLQGEHRRTVDLYDVWMINELTAAHGQLFATEYYDEAEDIEDEAVIERASADMGKRVLTLSPQLEVLHEFRGEGVPGEHDFCGMAPRGDNELLVTNFDHGKIHVLSI